MGFRCIGRCDEIYRFVFMLAERSGLQRERLRRRGEFAWNIALRNGPLFDAEDGLACFSIENEYEPQFSGLNERRNFLSFDRDIQENGRRRQVHVPDIVMDRLKVPLELPGRRLERDDRVAEEVITLAIETVVVAGRASIDR